MNKLAVAVTLTLAANSTHAEVESALSDIRKLFGLDGATITPAAAAAAASTSTDDNEDEGVSSNGAATDKNGLPWDERIHASTKALNKDGTWRYRKGIDEGTKTKVEADLRKLAAANAAAPAATPAAPPAPNAAPAAPSAPPAPAGKSAYEEFVDYVTENSPEKGGRCTPEWLKQVLAWKGIPDGLLANVAHASPELIADIRAYMVGALAG
jgi:hypothetical protein